MGTVLTVYSHNAFKRFLLPAVNDSDYTLLLAENLFSIQRDIKLNLEVRDNKWYFVRSEHYELSCMDESVDCYSTHFQNDADSKKNEFKLFVDNEHIVTIVVNVVDDYFSPYVHYQLPPDGSVITIGREADNTMCYDYRGTNQVSQVQTVIFKSGNEVVVQDNNSVNGTFVNNRRIEGSCKLAFGDCIDIFELRIVCLGDSIAVNVSESGVKVNKD